MSVRISTSTVLRLVTALAGLLPAPFALAPALCALLLAGVPSSSTAAPTSPVPASAHAKTAEMKPFTADDLVRIKRVTDPQVSPDGHYVAFVLRETDMEANRGRTDVWLLDLTQQDAAPAHAERRE